MNEANSPETLKPTCNFKYDGYIPFMIETIYLLTMFAYYLFAFSSILGITFNHFKLIIPI